MHTLIVVLLLTFLSLDTKSAFGAELPDLVAVCKSDCPKAKTNEEAHKCAEKLGRLNKSFQKSNCYQENEKYEEMTKDEKKEAK